MLAPTRSLLQGRLTSFGWSTSVVSQRVISPHAEVWANQAALNRAAHSRTTGLSQPSSGLPVPATRASFAPRPVSLHPRPAAPTGSAPRTWSACRRKRRHPDHAVPDNGPTGAARATRSHRRSTGQPLTRAQRSMHRKLPHDARLARQRQVVPNVPGCPRSRDGERSCRAPASNPGFGLAPRTAVAGCTDSPPALDAAATLRRRSIHGECRFANSTASPTRPPHLRALNRRQRPAYRIGQRQHQPAAVAPWPTARRSWRRIPYATVIGSLHDYPSIPDRWNEALDE